MAGSHAGKFPVGSSPRGKYDYQAARRCTTVMCCQFFGGHVTSWMGRGIAIDAEAQSLRPGQREGQLPVLRRSKAVVLAGGSTGWAAEKVFLNGRGTWANGAWGIWARDEGVGVRAGGHSIMRGKSPTGLELWTGDKALLTGTSCMFSAILVSWGGLLVAGDKLMGTKLSLLEMDSDGEFSSAGNTPAAPNTCHTGRGRQEELFSHSSCSLTVSLLRELRSPLYQSLSCLHP